MDWNTAEADPGVAAPSATRHLYVWYAVVVLVGLHVLALLAWAVAAAKPAKRPVPDFVAKAVHGD